jgi:hypothetical protein
VIVHVELTLHHQSNVQLANGLVDVALFGVADVASFVLYETVYDVQVVAVTDIVVL